MNGTGQPVMRRFRTKALSGRKAWVLALALASAVGLLGCSRGSYPLDFFSEMHYNQSYKLQEPQAQGELPRGSSAPSDSVPITGRGLSYTLTEAKELKNPAPAGASSVQKGQALFMVNCAMCHGQDARGGDSGPMGPKLAANGYLAKPADLTAGGPITNKVDGEVFLIIGKGYGPVYGLPADIFVMPAFEKLLSEEGRWQIIRYLRTLP